MRFRDRVDAGRALADRLKSLSLTDPVVLALPRGGVPVAVEIAQALGSPMDVFVARKIGCPGHPELGIGAIAEGGSLIADPTLVARLGIDRTRLAQLAESERKELERRVHLYRGGRPLPELAGRDVVLVDDGLATGVTAEAALRALRGHEPSRLILAVPVCAPETAARLQQAGYEVVCVLEPPNFYAVGQWYDRFDQTGDEEVLALLDRTRRPAAGRR